MESNHGNFGDHGDHAGYDPRDALADVAATHAAVADRLITPWWYHPALGAALSVLVVVSALDLNVAVRTVVAPACAVAIGLLAGTYQRMTGLWVDVRNLGPVSTRWWTLYAVLIVVVVGLSLVPTLTDITLTVPVTALLAATAFFGTIVLGRKMDAALRAEIRSGTAAAQEPRR